MGTPSSTVWVLEPVFVIRLEGNSLPFVSASPGCLFVLRERVSGSPGWPLIPYGAKDGLGLLIVLLSPLKYWVAGVYITVAQFCLASGRLGKRSTSYRPSLSFFF